MKKTFRPRLVDPPQLLPPSVDEFVPAGQVAHFIGGLVRDQLDLSGILAAYTEVRGYLPCDPTMTTALLLYGYSRGVYSSRRLARASEERLAFMAVTAMNRPDFRTISDFRKRHLEALSGRTQAQNGAGHSAGQGTGGGGSKGAGHRCPRAYRLCCRQRVLLRG